MTYTTDPAQRTAVEQVIRKLAEATTADGAIALFADSPHLMMITPEASGAARSIADCRAMLETDLANRAPDFIELNVVAEGNFAVASSVRKGSGERHLMETAGLELSGGAWKIVQLHRALAQLADGGSLDQPGSMAYTDDFLSQPRVDADQARQEIERSMIEVENTAVLPVSMSYYGPGQNVNLYNAMTGQVCHGIEAVTGSFSPQMTYTNVDATPRDLSILTDGLIGTVIGVWDAELTFPDGSKFPATFFMSGGVHRNDGKWTFFHEQVSA